MASTYRRLSAAQRRMLEALALDGALMMPNTSADWPVKLGPSVLTMVRWVTIEALARAGHIVHAEWPGAYRITGAGRPALVEGAKGSETV